MWACDQRDKIRIEFGSDEAFAVFIEMGRIERELSKIVSGPWTTRPLLPVRRM
jgi:hypothetical protein